MQAHTLLNASAATVPTPGRRGCGARQRRVSSNAKNNDYVSPRVVVLNASTPCQRRGVAGGRTVSGRGGGQTRREVSVAMHASSTADDQPGAGGIEDGKEGEEGGVDGEGEPLGASPSSSSEGEAGDAGESGDAAASAPAAEEEEEEKQKEEEKTKKKRASSSALPPTEDDVAPALEGDWRDFRAMLVSQEAGPETSTSRDEDSTKLAPSENMELLQRQNPKLASEKAWAHVIGAPERGCLLLASDDEFKQGQQYFHQSVILLLEHHDKGSMGVILNRPTQYNMGGAGASRHAPPRTQGCPRRAARVTRCPALRVVKHRKHRSESCAAIIGSTIAGPLHRLTPYTLEPMTVQSPPDTVHPRAHDCLITA